MENEFLLPHEVATRFGVTPATVRTWEASGVLSPAMRTGRGVRLYARGDVERLEVRRAQMAGDTRPARGARG